FLPLVNESSNYVAFPHPQSGEDHGRNYDVADARRVQRNLVEWAVDVADDRDRQDKVDPANDRAFGGFGHCCPPFGSTPNCCAYSLVNRCQPSNLIASWPTMRPMGSPAR